MQVDDALLAKLEKLSFLKVSDNKRDEIKEQLSQIMSFVDNLVELNTDGVDDKFAMSDKSTMLRDDLVSCNAQINEDLIKNAPQSQDNFFIVPKIIE